MYEHFPFVIIELVLIDSGETNREPIKVRHFHYFQPVLDRALVEDTIKGGVFNYSQWKPVTAIPGFYSLGDS